MKKSGWFKRHLVSRLRHSSLLGIAILQQLVIIKKLYVFLHVMANRIRLHRTRSIIELTFMQCGRPVLMQLLPLTQLGHVQRHFRQDHWARAYVFRYA